MGCSWAGATPQSFQTSLERQLSLSPGTHPVGPETRDTVRPAVFFCALCLTRRSTTSLTPALVGPVGNRWKPAAGGKQVPGPLRSQLAGCHHSSWLGHGTSHEVRGYRAGGQGQVSRPCPHSSLVSWKLPVCGGRTPSGTERGTVGPGGFVLVPIEKGPRTP